MRRLSVFMLALGLAPLQAQEFRVGLGVFTLAKHGLDIQADFRLKQSPWQAGFKYVQWTDTSKDPFSGHTLAEKKEAMVGPFVNYLFRPEGAGSWYLGGSVLRWSMEEHAFFTGETSRASTTSPYIGGGFTGTMGRHFYYNMGIFFSPGAKLATHTSVSSEQVSGGLDIQIQVGMRL